jgi:hypothetical protein
MTCGNTSSSRGCSSACTYTRACRRSHPT